MLMLAAWATGAWAADTVPAASRPPVESFFENPAFSPRAAGAGCTPFGDPRGHRGQARRARGDRRRNDGLQGDGQFSDADVGAFEWVNNDRLLFNSRTNPNVKLVTYGDEGHG
jgi:hypothetical protein